MESSRGGNSHQSETNLIEKTPEATLPGARKGSGLVKTRVRVFPKYKLPKTVSGLQRVSGYSFV